MFWPGVAQPDIVMKIDERGGEEGARAEEGGGGEEGRRGEEGCDED